jgi:hypothetical protein
MSAIETVDTDRQAGITDAAWWQWFDEIPDVADPWQDWLRVQRFPHAGPLLDWLEYRIAELIKAADIMRLATQPTTKTFGRQWDTFRHHHCELDGRGKYRRQRYMIWRAAALKVLCDRNRFQDEIDAGSGKAALKATMLWFWPDIDIHGNHPGGGNFWRVEIVKFGDGTLRPDPMTEYAVMVLSLMRKADATVRSRHVAD